MFCEDCHSAGRPFSGLRFVLYGYSRQGYYVKRSKGGIKGFTPHTVHLLRINGHDVVLEKICAVCGYLIKDKEDDDCTLTKVKSSIISMPHSDFNAMVIHADRNFGYKID